MKKTHQLSDTLHEVSLMQSLTGIVHLTDQLTLNICLNWEHKHGDHLYLKQQVLEMVVHSRMLDIITYMTDKCG